VARLPIEGTLVRRVLSPASRTDGIVHGEPVDRAVSGGSHGAVITIITGAVAGTHTLTIEDSADGETGWAAVPASQIQGAVPEITASEANGLFEVGIGLSRRFLRVSVTTTGAVLDGGVVAAVIVLNELRFSPVTR
jgi:hypothetical protein